MGENDIERYKRVWKNWKEKNYPQIEGFKKENSDIAWEFITDNITGQNVNKTRYGGKQRSPGTLMNFVYLFRFLNFHFPDKNWLEITPKEMTMRAIEIREEEEDENKIIKEKLNEEEMQKFLSKKRKRKFKIGSTRVDSLRNFGAWLQRTNKTKESFAKDLCSEDFKENEKGPWVYVGEENMRKIIDSAKGDYRAIFLWMYDAGMRPQEALRLRVKDFSKDYKELTIPLRDDKGRRVSKTFERTIILKQCSKMIKAYIENNKLKENDLVINKSYYAINKYLKSHVEKILGIYKTKSRGWTNGFTMYSIRHNSACYWEPRYKRNKDMMYRFGWMEEDKVFYYTEFLGKGDRIDDDDMMTKEDRNMYEEKLKEEKDKRKELEARIEALEKKDKAKNSMKEVEESEKFKEIHA